CAARNARPAATLALQHARRPTRLLTVFAGQDAAATERARSYFTGYPPSSPQMGLFTDGRLVFMLERKNIEGRPAQDIADDLTAAFDRYCRWREVGGGCRGRWRMVEDRPHLHRPPATFF